MSRHGATIRGVYRPSARPPRGAWANHLHDQRRKRELSSQQAFELVQERLGLSPKSRAVYTALDMGNRQPRPEEAEVLAAEFGWPPEGTQATTATTEPPTDLIAAITAQTAAIEALVALLQPLVEDREAGLTARLGELEPVVRRLAERDLGVPPEPPLHRETAG